MVKLEGIVLHSSDIDLTSRFYEALLRVKFREEKHGEKGKRHYAVSLDNNFLLEIYPLLTKSSSSTTFPAPPTKAPPVLRSDPSFIFNVRDLEATLEAVNEYTHGKVEKLDFGAKIYDPDQRSIYLHEVRD